eukprot:4798103-Amphidinium_carterae.2
MRKDVVLVSQHSGAPLVMEAHKDGLLDSLPLVERSHFVHRSDIYQDSMAERWEQLLEKIMTIIHHEVVGCRACGSDPWKHHCAHQVAGFQMDALTGKHLRSKLFKRNVPSMHVPTVCSADMSKLNPE